MATVISQVILTFVVSGARSSSPTTTCAQDVDKPVDKVQPSPQPRQPEAAPSAATAEKRCAEFETPLHSSRF